MTITFVGEGHGQVTNNALTVALPAGIQGQDTIIWGCGSLDSTIGMPAGYTERDRQLNSTLLGLVEFKQAAGTVGAGSADASASVVFNPAVLGAGHKTSACGIVLRGANPAAPVNAEAYVAAAGTTSFVGPSVTSTVDDCTIVSIFIDKDSTNPLNITPPAGYTQRSAAVFGSGSGKANVVIATKAGGAAGNYGADTWTTDAIPGTVSIFTLAIAPISTTQTIVPAADRLDNNATGVPVDTAGALYTNLNQGTDAKYIQLPVGGEISVDLTALNNPGVNTGFSVPYRLMPLAGTASTDWQLKLIQDPAGANTTIATWTETGVTAATTFSHPLSSGVAATIVYTSGKAANLTLYAKLTAAS
jgi:hypothetical protein